MSETVLFDRAGGSMFSFLIVLPFAFAITCLALIMGLLILPFVLIGEIVKLVRK